MRVKELLNIKGRTVYSIPINATIMEALEKMVKNNVGSLLVLDENQGVKGIISERDILKKCVYFGKSLNKEKVSDFYTSNILIISPDDELEYAMEIMTLNRIRHLPVVEENSLIGLISIGDVVKAQLKEFKIENKYLKDYISAKYPG